jgi:hypothetical protein
MVRAGISPEVEKRVTIQLLRSSLPERVPEPDSYLKYKPRTAACAATGGDLRRAGDLPPRRSESAAVT